MTHQSRKANSNKPRYFKAQSSQEISDCEDCTSRVTNFISPLTNMKVKKNTRDWVGREQSMTTEVEVESTPLST